MEIDITSRLVLQKENHNHYDIVNIGNKQANFVLLCLNGYEFDRLCVVLWEEYCQRLKAQVEVARQLAEKEE